MLKLERIAAWLRIGLRLDEAVVIADGVNTWSPEQRDRILKVAVDKAVAIERDLAAWSYAFGLLRANLVTSDEPDAA